MWFNSGVQKPLLRYPPLVSIFPPDDGSEYFYIFIPGAVEPGGSPKIVTMGGRPAIRWQKGPKWTAKVRAALGEVIPPEARPLLKGPVRGWLDFVMERPTRPKFEVPATPPDIDKLIRSTLDGMIEMDHGTPHPILVEDDARFISLGVTESYGIEIGAHIWVWSP